MAASNIPLLSGAILLQDSAAANAAVAVKASSAVVYEIEVDNSANGAATYLKVFNVAGGSVSVGTTAPDFIFMVPASVSRTLVLPSGLTFGTALSYCAVTSAGTAGSTSPTSSVPIKLVYV